MRLFVALLLAPTWQDMLGRFGARLRQLDAHSNVRWVDPGGIHLTLRFLGDVPESRLPALCSGLEQALCGQAAPLLAARELGAFPNWRRPRVIWLGLEEQGDRLRPLQAQVEKAVRRLGWSAEERPFRAHLTLGRVRDTRHGVPDELARALLGERLPSQPPRAQTRLALVRSHLSRAGARYEDLRVWELENRA